MRYSLKEADYHEVVGALLFMAGKIGSGENFVKMERLVKAVAHDCNRGEPEKRSRLQLDEHGRVDFQA